MIALVVLVSHVAFGHDALNLALEGWLVPPDGGQPGRSSPATATSILLLGGALLSVGRRRADRYLAWCAASGMLLTAIELLGYGRS